MKITQRELLIVLFISFISLLVESVFGQTPNQLKEDTTFYYYQNGAVSVKLNPFENATRIITLYDSLGNATITFEDVRKSYSVSHQLKFHSNGAVKSVEEHTNPGASMYMYQSDMTFSENNLPLTRVDSTTPTTLEEYMKDHVPWHWDSKNKKWYR